MIRPDDVLVRAPFDKLRANGFFDYLRIDVVEAA